MTIALAASEAVARPWGIPAAHFGFEPGGGIERVGEVRFRRPDTMAAGRLGLRLVLAGEPVAVEVHPPGRGGEACYVLQAGPEARIGHGLRKEATADAVHAALDLQVLPRLLRWIGVKAGDALPIPAGVLHAIGGGLVLAVVGPEREEALILHDYRRGQPLDVEAGIAAADLGPGPDIPGSVQVDQGRTVLVEGPDLVLERVVLQPGRPCRLEFAEETWVLVVAGEGRLGGAMPLPSFAAAVADGGAADFEPGPRGATLLVAYARDRVRPGLVRPGVLSHR
ncbi:hypothetical protein [Prosthecomicrobium sp. N25]|uniref:hypothetical protein n=1 Tax=Prosthecomicrobium sp. N25 TaxID=3129254 RepID=UPI00307824C9